MSRPISLQVYVTSELAARVRVAAAADGLAVSEWLRSVIFRACEDEISVSVDPGHRARLYRQLVERKMLGPEAERAGEFAMPVGERLTGSRVDQVEGEAREDRPRHFDRGQRLGDAVHAAEPLQVGIVQRLHAERHAVDARGPIPAEAPAPNPWRNGAWH